MSKHIPISASIARLSHATGLHPIKTGKVDPTFLRRAEKFEFRYRSSSHVEDLITSLETVGQTSPIAVNANMEVFIGRRRAKALEMINERRILYGIPPMEARYEMFEVPDEEAASMAAQDNIRHQKLSVMDIAYVCSRLKDNFGFTETKIGQLFANDSKPGGYTQAWVSQQMSLLDLPTFIMDSIDTGQLTKAVGVALCSLPMVDRTKFIDEMTLKGRKITVNLVKERAELLKQERQTLIRPETVAAARPRPMDAFEIRDFLRMHSQKKHSVISEIYVTLLTFFESNCTDPYLTTRFCEEIVQKAIDAAKGGD